MDAPSTSSGQASLRSARPVYFFRIAESIQLIDVSDIPKNMAGDYARLLKKHFLTSSREKYNG
jgi:hypothetical protein